MQAVGELDEDHAHVARHREEHFAEILGLRVLGRLEFDLVQLGNAVHQIRDGFAKRIGDLGLGDRGVFHHVVQQRGHQRLAVEVPAGEDLGDRERMGDVGLARLARLARVRGAREAVGLGEARDVRRLQVAEACFVKDRDRDRDCSHLGGV